MDKKHTKDKWITFDSLHPMIQGAIRSTESSNKNCALVFLNLKAQCIWQYDNNKIYLFEKMFYVGAPSAPYLAAFLSGPYPTLVGVIQRAMIGYYILLPEDDQELIDWSRNALSSLNALHMTKYNKYKININNILKNSKVVYTDLQQTPRKQIVWAKDGFYIYENAKQDNNIIGPYDYTLVDIMAKKHMSTHYEYHGGQQMLRKFYIDKYGENKNSGG